MYINPEIGHNSNKFYIVEYKHIKCPADHNWYRWSVETNIKDARRIAKNKTNTEIKYRILKCKPVKP